MISTITDKNQITLPAELAAAIGLQPGGRIEWKVGGEGILIGQVLPSRGELARAAEGMGKAWLKEGEDPIAELIAERAKDDYDEGLE